MASVRLTVADIIAKRKQRWAEKRDIAYDEQLVHAGVVRILSDPVLSSEIIEKPYLLVEAAFYIIDKDKRQVPFFFNTVQQDFISKLEANGTRLPYLILKGRQQGFTSVITAIQLAFSIVRRNFSGATISHRSDSTKAIFNDKAKVVFDRLPEELKPSIKFNSKTEYFFDKLNSSWRVATADDNIFRGMTLSFAHFSEAAFYECSLAELQKGIGEALTANAIVVYETTANGFNEIKDMWEGSGCIKCFYGWWLTAEYRSTEYEYLNTGDPWLIDRIKVLEGMGLDREQITWYCKKYDGYLDKSSIRQEYPCSPEEAFVSSGDCIFDKEKISNRLAACSGIAPLSVGYFDYRVQYTPVFDDSGRKIAEEKEIVDVKWVESKDGFIRLHEHPAVKLDGQGEVIGRAPYVIGGDTAGSGEDYFAAKVINNITGHTAATLHRQRMDEDKYAEQLICLGKHYNNALIGVEINYSREPMRIIQQEYGYTNVYMREKLDGINDEIVRDAGFNTTSKTRPIILAELVRLFREDPEMESDIVTLKEMSVFVKKANGRQEAIEGQHDDLVMSLAIAHFVAGQQTVEWITTPVEKNKFISENFHINGNEYSQAVGNSGGFMDWDDL